MNERTMPGGSGDERSLLDGWLDYYRIQLLAKCEGLTGDQFVTRSCEPSPMPLIGLVRHMTEMERMYGHRLADWGTGLLYCTDEDEERRLYGGHRRRCGGRPGDIPRALRQDQGNNGGARA